jgi:ankyrin repeat protein
MECVNLLLVRGADVDAVDEIGYTAMHLCAERGYLDLMLLLLQHGARIRFSDIKREAEVEDYV